MRIAFLLLVAAPAFAESVDVELALAVDTSRSMDFDELTLQRDRQCRAVDCGWATELLSAFAERENRESIDIGKEA